MSASEWVILAGQVSFCREQLQANLFRLWEQFQAHGRIGEQLQNNWFGWLGIPIISERDFLTVVALVIVLNSFLQLRINRIIDARLKATERDKQESAESRGLHQ